MSIDPVLLARYLAQAADLGGDVFLDSLSGVEARRLVARAARSADAAPQPYAPAHTAAAGAPGMTREDARAALASMFAEGAAATGGVGAHDTATLDAPARLAPDLVGGLQQLAVQAQDCTRCRLAESRTHVVFGEGNPAAHIVVVGEAPGQEEDRTGRPFVGRAGRLLDLLLLSAGYPRADVYICNVLKCRPPGNRNPLADEVAACTSTWLYAQLGAIAPRVLIAVGKFAAQTLCASEESIGRLRGRMHDFNGTPLIVTYHPAYLLRSPEMVRVAWQDFQLLRKVHDEQA